MNKALSDHFKTNNVALNDLAKAGETGPGRGLLLAAEFMRDREREALEAKPTRGEDDVTKGVEYRLGFIAGMKSILSIPDQARKHLEKLPETPKEIGR